MGCSMNMNTKFMKVRKLNGGYAVKLIWLGNAAIGGNFVLAFINALNGKIGKINN